MFRTLRPRDSISVAVRKLLQGGSGEYKLYTSLQQREQAIWTPKIRYQVKEFSILSMGRCKPLLLLSRFCRVRLCDPVDSSPPGSSARGILRARILEWAATSFSIHGLHMHLSYLGPVLFPHSPCSLHCSISTAITMRRDSILWIAVLGALIHI